MSSLSLRDPLLRFGLLLLGLVQLSLFIAALYAVGTAPTSVPALIPGNQRCAWVLDEPDRPCVVAINGNPLPPPRPTTSVESLHLNTRSLAAQDALYSSMRGQTTAVLTLGGPQPKERVVALGPNFPTQRSVEVALCSAGAFAFALVGWFFLFRTGNKARSRLFVAGSQAGMVVLLSAMVLGSSPVAISPLDLRLYAMLGAGGTLFGALTAAQMALQVCERPAAMARLHALIGVLSVGVMAVEVVTHIGIAFVFAELLLLATGALFLHSALYAPLPADRRDATGFLVGMLAPMGVAGALRLLSLLGLERLLPDPLALIATAIAAPMTMLLSTLREGSFDAEDGLRRLVGGLAVLVLVGLPGLGVGIGVWSVRDTGAEWGAVELALFVILSLFVLPIGAGLAESATRLVFAARQRRRDALSRLAEEVPDQPTVDAAVHLTLSHLCGILTLKRAEVDVVALGDGPRRWCYERHEGRLTLSDPPAEPFPALPTTTLLLRTPGRQVGRLSLWSGPQSAVMVSLDRPPLERVASALAVTLALRAAQEAIQAMNASLAAWNRDLEAQVARHVRERDEARAELYIAEKMTSIHTFASGVAHELNTPLGVSRSAADQLVMELEEEGNPRTRRLARLAYEGSLRASAIVTALSELSSRSDGALQPVDLERVIEATLRLLERKIAQAGVQVSLELAPLPTIEAHPTLVGQVLVNLLQNALLAMPTGGSLCIGLRQPDPQQVELSVQDSGPGVDPALRERIFEPFFTTREPGSGTGLGLSLSWTFVRRHGGRIWVEAAPGGGARFVVRLPLRPGLTPIPVKSTTPPSPVSPSFNPRQDYAKEDHL